jgi:arylsulfatase A-like enzyme
LTILTGNETHPTDSGFDRFYGSIANVANFNESYFRWTKIEHDAGEPPPVPFTTTTWYGTATSTDARNWINAQSNAFFAYVCFNPPHGPFEVPPQALVSASTRDEITCLGFEAGDQATDSDPVQKRRLFYKAMLEAVDTEIGNLLDTIDPAKLANTMIIRDGGQRHAGKRDERSSAHRRPREAHRVRVGRESSADRFRTSRPRAWGLRERRSRRGGRSLAHHRGDHRREPKPRGTERHDRRRQLPARHPRSAASPGKSKVRVLAVLQAERHSAPAAGPEPVLHPPRALRLGRELRVPPHSRREATRDDCDPPTYRQYFFRIGESHEQTIDLLTTEP